MEAFLTMEVTCALIIGRITRKRMYVVRKALFDTTIAFERDGVGSVVLCEWSGHSI